MTTTLSTHAATAKAIRATLKSAFPTVTFKVRASVFAGGDSVDIDWTDGPTVREVDALVAQHEYGHFDGSIDLYEYSNARDDIPQVRFVQTQRDYSDDARRATVALLNRTRGYTLRFVTKTYGDRSWIDIDPLSDAYTGNGFASNEVHRTLYARSLLCASCGAATLPGDAFCPQCGTAVSS